MKIVGELFQDRQTAVPLIGIFPWGVINGRDDLAGQRGGTVSYTRKPPTREGAPLNKDHTHFLLVDDGKVGGVAWGSEIGFRSAMEKELAACSGTLIQIVIQGGPGTLATCAGHGPGRHADHRSDRNRRSRHGHVRFLHRWH